MVNRLAIQVELKPVFVRDFVITVNYSFSPTNHIAESLFLRGCQLHPEINSFKRNLAGNLTGEGWEAFLYTPLQRSVAIVSPSTLQGHIIEYLLT
jgi:hypothetical protein